MDAGKAKAKIADKDKISIYQKVPLKEPRRWLQEEPRTRLKLCQQLKVWCCFMDTGIAKAKIADKDKISINQKVPLKEPRCWLQEQPKIRSTKRQHWKALRKSCFTYA